MAENFSMQQKHEQFQRSDNLKKQHRLTRSQKYFTTVKYTLRSVVKCVEVNANSEISGHTEKQCRNQIVEAEECFRVD
jgi:hypothetical protein